jgi:hypothetical protein
MVLTMAAPCLKKLQKKTLAITEYIPQKLPNQLSNQLPKKRLERYPATLPNTFNQLQLTT